LLTLIDEVLDFSEIETGKTGLSLETFDISNLIEEVVNAVQPLVEKNANSLEVHCNGDPGTMHADLAKVRQALYNLLSNACKFTEKGSISLHVAHERLDGRDWIEFGVSDTGIGMTADQTKGIFQAFTQVESPLTRRHGGIGLGLVISRRFCQMMGGEITVKSEYGKGSTFTMRLPAEVSQMIQTP
jgi:signal transduction histidine kinase